MKIGSLMPNVYPVIRTILWCPIR